MAARYRLLSRRQVKSYLPEIKRQQVSKVARSKRGFTHYYLNSSGRISAAWSRKRNAFIARHLPQYHDNPTARRYLALIAWAYKPPKKH